MFRRALFASTLLLLAGPAVTGLKANDSLAFGIVADVRIAGTVYIEALFDRQCTTFKADIPNNPIDLFDAKSDWYHIGLHFETPRQNEPRPRFLLGFFRCYELHP